MKKAEERIDRNVDKINKEEDTCVNNKINNNLGNSDNINRSSVNPSKCGFVSDEAQLNKYLPLWYCVAWV